jgi:hypothetical protein
MQAMKDRAERAKRRVENMLQSGDLPSERPYEVFCVSQSLLSAAREVLAEEADRDDEDFVSDYAPTVCAE